MPTTRSPRAFASLLLLAAAAFPDEGTKIVVPQGKAPVMDGVLSEEEWRSAPKFALARGDEEYGSASLFRAGRDLYIGFASKVPPFAVGLRFMFVDPASEARVLALVTPLSPPQSPLALFREPAEGGAVPREAWFSDVRFSFPPDDTFTMELRLPLDDLDIGRPARDYAFSAQVWDLASDRAVGAFPVTAQGMMITPKLALLSPDKDWGADAPSEASARRTNAGIAFLQAMVRSSGAAPEGEGAAQPRVEDLLGIRDGRRQDGTLRDMETMVRELIGKYPDYVSLRAIRMRVLLGLNDFEGAYALAQEMKASFPSLAMLYRHAVVEVQLLRDLGRYQDALKMFEENESLVHGTRELQGLKRVILALDANWRIEQEIRAEEAKRDDLPRVRWKTTRGDVLLELFEDDVPNAVANFIALTESGFYDGTRFHWSEGGGRIAGGDPNSRDEDPFNDGFGGPPRMIESEPGRRLNFAYTIAMLDRRRTRRTEGSIFYVNIASSPQLDGLSTVFGRVIEGQDVIRRLQYNDTLVEAKVVRKRDHPYQPAYR